MSLSWHKHTQKHTYYSERSGLYWFKVSSPNRETESVQLWECVGTEVNKTSQTSIQSIFLPFVMAVVPSKSLAISRRESASHYEAITGGEVTLQSLTRAKKSFEFLWEELFALKFFEIFVSWYSKSFNLLD